MTEEKDAADVTDAFWFFTKKEEEEPGFVLAQKPEDDYYKMDNPRRGVALIFNQMNFTNPECPPRDGTNKDRDDLAKLYANFGFEVMIHDDLNAAEIYDVLDTVSKMDHSKADCLVVTVMTHGIPEKIFAKDCEYPTKLLWTKFSAHFCPTLVGKPKLFFIQACRGTGLDHGVRVKQSRSIIQSDSRSEQTYTLPVMADILVMYSTVDGYYSWRDPSKGAYFIQSLVEQMHLYGYKRDLLTILTFVNRQVAIEFSSRDEGVLKGCKQMCSMVSMLTRLVYFKEK